MKPSIEIVACSPANSPVIHESLKAGKIVNYDNKETLSDGTAGDMEEGSITFDLCQAVVDRSITVPEADIVSSLQQAFKLDSLKIEGAAGVAIAGYTKDADNRKDKECVVIICGGNID